MMSLFRIQLTFNELRIVLLHITATGLLLRTVDPDNKTIAAASFAGKQLLHEPGMNVWVALAFALVFTVGWMPVFLVSLLMLVIWIAVSIVLMRRNKKD